ncbi:MAG TPA: hypothetical protein IAB15_00500 [Candidatus Ornithoclostridium faecigallinarum]|nr:hypothetical protein [Candidatus Ornithoclostridium faecigallinarum]
MKKFLGLIVLLVALAVCAATLVACDPDSGDHATPQSIKFEDKDGADRSTYWDLGAFPYGTAYEDILPTFKVNLCYSDGSTKELAAGDYTVSYVKIEEEDVPLQSIPAVPDAGLYQIIFDKDEFQARMFFTVESVVRTDLTLSLPRNEWEYDEANPTPTVEGYSATDGDEPLFYCVDKAVFDALTDEQKAEYWRHTIPMYNLGGEPCTVAVGEYYAYAEIPQDNNFTVSYTAITPENAFTVKKAVLHYDSAVSSNLQAVFNYHSGILGGINLGNLNIAVKDFSIATGLKDRTGAEILGQYVWADSSVTVDSDDNGKTFAARYELDSVCEASYTVEDGGIPVILTVNKGAVMQPQLSIDSDNAHSANESFGPYPDNALPYAVVNDDGGYNVRIFGEWDKNIIEITVKRLNSDGSSTTNKVTGLIGTLLDDGTYKYCLNWAFIDPAEYAVTLSLKDKTNFTWYDGTSEDSVFRFEIKEKKAVPVPTAHLRDSATDTEDVDFSTFDGAAHAIDFTDFTENAVYTTVNGESVYAIPETDNRAYYLLESETIAENIDSAGEWVVNVALTPAPEYTWADGSVTPVEYTCKINAYTTFFPGIKVANAYTALDPTNPTADDTEVMQLMNDWLGVDGAGKMETDCRDYNAAVYFTAFRDGESLAQYIGTVTNSHTSSDNFGTYSMTFHLTDIANKAAPTHYHGTADVEAGSKVDSTIYPNDNPFFSVDKISDYDIPFFLIAKVDCREAVQSENITYAYATVGDCTVVKIKGDNGGDGVNSEKVTSEVYLVFRGGEYVGHEINTTVKIGEVNTTYFLQFALTL